MQYDVHSAEEYLNGLEEDWRKERLVHIRQLILACEPGIEEGIEYKMLRYGDEQSAVFHLNAQKNYVSLYVGNIEKIDPGHTLLAPFDKGKGCIRIKKNISLTETDIADFIEKAIQFWKAGKDIDC